MNNPFLNSIQLRILFLSIWVIIIITQIFLLQYFILFYPDIAICDSLITNTLHSFCILLVWYPIRYYRNTFNIPLFLLFHLLLLLLSFSIWLGLGYLITRLCVSEPFAYQNFFLNVLGLRIFSASLIYIIFTLTYYLFMARDELKERQRKIDNLTDEPQVIPLEKLSRISVKKRNTIHFIPVNQIHYIEANGDYVFIYTEGERYLKDKTMKYWEANLPNELFVRIHRSFIVNVGQIERVELYEKETYKIHLKNGNTLRASANGYKKLIKS